MGTFDLDDVITSAWDLSRGYVFRDGFAFTSIDGPANVYDALIVRNPARCGCSTPKLTFSGYSLEEHIDLINRYNIQKAKIIAEDISFLTQCPSLKYLDIIPADTALRGFDYSPLYDMPEICSLTCQTHYGEPKEQLCTTVDCAKIHGLRRLFVRGTGYLNFEKAETLEELFISEYRGLENLQGLSRCRNLKKLTLLLTDIQSSEGIDAFQNLQSLNLWYNRRLSDISEIGGIANSLRELTIQNCPKVADFSCLYALENMEALSLEGKNNIPNLTFLPNMRKLRFFICTMNVIDGDLTSCLTVPYADVKSRKHYCLKNKDLPKHGDPKGFHII